MAAVWLLWCDSIYISRTVARRRRDIPCTTNYYYILTPRHPYFLSAELLPSNRTNLGVHDIEYSYFVNTHSINFDIICKREKWLALVAGSAEVQVPLQSQAHSVTFLGTTTIVSV